MRIILLLIAASVVTHCDRSDIDTEISGFHHDLLDRKERKDSETANTETGNGFGTSIPPNKFSILAQTSWKELKPSNEQQKRIVQQLKEAATRSRDYNQNFSAHRMNSEQGNGRIMLHSDIVPKKPQVDYVTENVESDCRTKRHVMKDYGNETVAWKDGVFYMFNTSDPIVQKVFKMGVKVWSDVTCIDFVEDENAEDKVVVIKEVGCWSHIGRIGGDQRLSLGKGCEAEGIAVHEIGHVVGLFHTMNRYDRDDHIRIVMGNVKPESVHEFEIVNKDLVEVYGLSYDYGSVMHYGELSWSINKKPTMIATDPYQQKTMGSRIISFSDIFVINERYGCNAKCNNFTSAKCENEGFPHPRNCSICICPGGYGGALCDQRPPGCGEDLVATNEKQTQTYSLGFGTDLRDQFSFCNYMITAPDGKKIEVDGQSISGGYNSNGCRKGGIEIKAQKDQKLTGYRFCSKKDAERPIISTSNRLPVILFSRLGTLEGNFTYRYVN